MEENDDRLTKIGNIPVMAASQVTLNELFQIDQNQAIGENILQNLSMMLAECLINHRADHDGEGHPGRHLAPADFIETLAELNEDHVKALLMLACWILAEQQVSLLELRQMMVDMSNHECGPECEDGDHGA